MAKLTLSPISSRYASVSALNTNFDAIETALENTLSRDGTSPNPMTSDLDMNGNRILNALAQSGDGFIWEGAWVTATAYAVNNLIQTTGNTYICLVAHTSGTFATDLAAGKWELMASKGASGAGAGDMLGSNNLSELTDTTAARTNLGVAIGSQVQAYDADLTTWAGVTPGTGVATALAVNVGSAGAPVVFNGALGTPSSGDLSNCTGGGLAAASQAQQETATSNVVSVTPANQQYHPSAPKAWARFNGATAGTNAPSKGYNVTSIQRTGTGAYTVNLAITMSDAVYAVVVSAPGSSNSGNTYYNSIAMDSQTATTFTLSYAAGALSDPSIVCFAVYGDI